MALDDWYDTVRRAETIDDDPSGRILETLPFLRKWKDHVPKDVYAKLFELYESGVRKRRIPVMLDDEDSDELSLFLDNVCGRIADGEVQLATTPALDIGKDFGLNGSLLLFLEFVAPDIHVHCRRVEDTILEEFLGRARPHLAAEELERALRSSDPKDGEHVGDSFFRIATVGNQLRAKHRRSARMKSSIVGKTVWAQCASHCGRDSEDEAIRRAVDELFYVHACNSSRSLDLVREGKEPLTVEQMFAEPEVVIPPMLPSDMRYQPIESFVGLAMQFLSASLKVWPKARVLSEWRDALEVGTDRMDGSGADSQWQRDWAAKLVMRYHSLMSPHYKAVRARDDSFILESSDPEFEALGARRKWSLADPETRETIFEFLDGLNRFAHSFSLYMRCPQGMFAAVVDIAKGLVAKSASGSVNMAAVLKGGLHKFGFEVFARTSPEERAQFLASLKNDDAVDSIMDLLEALMSSMIPGMGH
jgi:hypothetical protein